MSRRGKVARLGTLLWTLLWTIGACLSPAAVHAALLPPQPTEDITVQMIDGHDVAVSGIEPTVDLAFPGPGSYSTTNGTELTLHFSHSPLLLASRSTLTVRANDVPVGSVFLTKANSTSGTVQLPLPPSPNNPDIWHLQVAFYLRLSNASCATDAGNPALNATIFSDTTLHYVYGPRLPVAPEPDLHAYPAPFLSATALNPGHLDIVLPRQPDDQTLTGAVHLAAGLGTLTGGRQPVLTFKDTATIDAKYAATHDLIVVGQPRTSWLWQGIVRKLNSQGAALPFRLSPSGQFVSSDGRALPADQGILDLLISPFAADRQILVVSGNSPAAVRRAADTLSRTRGRVSLHGPWAIVAKQAADSGVAAAPASPLPSVLVHEQTLGATGRPEVTLRGVGDQVVSWPFWTNASVAGGSVSGDLYFRHSRLLSSNRSSFQADVNSVPIANGGLNDGNATDGHMHFLVPAGVLHPGMNDFSVRFDLEPPARIAPTDCVAAPPNLDWAVLDGRSVLHVVQTQGAPTEPIDLASYPYPFVNRGSLGQTVLVLPADVEEMAAAATLAADLGSRAGGDVTTLHVRTDATLTDTERVQNNLILFGLVDANSVLRSLALPLALAPGGARAIREPSGPILIISDNAQVGILETIPSPWTSSRTVLIVSGRLPAALQWDAIALARQDLSGTAITVVAKGSATAPTQSIRMTSYDLRPPASAPVRAFQAARDNLPLALAGATILLGLALLAYMGYQVLAAERLRR